MLPLCKALKMTPLWIMAWSKPPSKLCFSSWWTKLHTRPGSLPVMSLNCQVALGDREYPVLGRWGWTQVVQKLVWQAWLGGEVKGKQLNLGPSRISTGGLSLLPSIELHNHCIALSPSSPQSVKSQLGRFWGLSITGSEASAVRWGPWLWAQLSESFCYLCGQRSSGNLHKLALFRLPHWQCLESKNPSPGCPPSFVQQVLTEWLECARHWVRCWKDGVQWARYQSYLLGI